MTKKIYFEILDFVFLVKKLEYAIRETYSPDCQSFQIEAAEFKFLHDALKKKFGL